MGAIYNAVQAQAVVANGVVDLFRPDKPSVKKNQDSSLFQTQKTSTAKQAKDSTSTAVLDLDFTDLFAGDFDAVESQTQAPVGQNDPGDDWQALVDQIQSQSPEERTETRARLEPEFFDKLATTKSASPELAALTVELLRDEPEFRKLMAGSSSEQQLQLNELKLMDIIINGNLDDHEVLVDARQTYEAVVNAFNAQSFNVAN